MPFQNRLSGKIEESREGVEQSSKKVWTEETDLRRELSEASEMTSPMIRWDRVWQLRSRILSGTYAVSADEVASSILQNPEASTAILPKP